MVLDTNGISHGVEEIFLHLLSASRLPNLLDNLSTEVSPAVPRWGFKGSKADLGSSRLCPLSERIGRVLASGQARFAQAPLNDGEGWRKMSQIL